MKRRLSIVVLVVPALAGSAFAQDADLATLLQAPVEIERAEDTTVIPVERRFGKLHVTAAVNGVERSFLFDTGSPTVISRELADELGLETVATNRGRDANGTVVEMEFAVAETITLGGVTFHDVPVLIYDFSQTPMGDCVFDGGHIGSEIFPNSIWQFDMVANELRISAPQNTPSYTPSGRFSARLLDAGYPHAPIVEYRIGSVADRALFDTGSGAGISLFDDLLENPDVARGVDAGSLREGRGSMGTSAGGEGAETALLRFDFDALELGGDRLTGVPGENRAIPPTLLGTALLDRYRVTLNYPAGYAIFDPLPNPRNTRPHPGFGISFREDVAVVSQLFNGSAAESAGVRLGDQVLAIDSFEFGGRDAAGRCEAMVAMTDGGLLSAAREITVSRNGEAQVLRLTAD
ncbi:retropepsin-like aspartic protease [Aurantiacibacter sp. D1-12]|uniref:retropepsin-like aspartic protease n=1 Tax=Aurantiacibacter sp. D1-12 TaxID=2993658 RepID=UPI00237D2BB1|nr:aspartyl protease family protein [Aurantiacibacter sp. D1-12]MDE1466804.1 aspartyl protease family protein [Aurantiacibacter sp. D1-12]